jgi:hypothetical protein
MHRTLHAPFAFPGPGLTEPPHVRARTHTRGKKRKHKKLEGS